MADLNASITTEPISLTDTATAGLTAQMTATASDSISLTDTVGDGAVVSIFEQAGWIVLLEIDADSGMITCSRDGVRTASDFYAGKVKRFGIFESSIPVPSDLVRINDVTCELIDTDNSLRTLFVPKTIKRRAIRWLLGREGMPRVSYQRIFSAQVYDVDFPPGAVRIMARSFVFDFYSQEVPPLLNKDNFPDLPDNPTGDFAPIILGTVSSPTGAIRCHQVDDSPAPVFLVARHPCESVDEVWVRQPEDTGWWEAPPLMYSVTGRSLNGSTSTELTWGMILPEGTEIRANVTGLTLDPAYGGIDLTNFSDVLMAIFRFFVGISYDLDHLNLSSFETVKAQMTSEGYVCAGAITEKCTVGKVVTDLVKSSGIDIYNDAYDRIALGFTQ